MLYFAYGSNMNEESFKKTCPNAKFLCIGKLSNYKLDFTRLSKNRQCGVADIVEQASSCVWGVIYEVPETNMPELDTREGYPSAYTRREIQVQTSKGVRNVFTYQVVDKSEKRILPSREYLNLILTGAKHRELPEDYIKQLEEIPTA